jgi:polysaccharide biosynthesis protein PslH
MRILYASMMLPYPPTFGKRMEIWAGLRALAAEGHRVTLVSFNDSGQQDVDLGPLSQVCESIDLVPIRLSGPNSVAGYLGRLACLLTRDPYDAWRFRSKAFHDALLHRLENEQYDAVICNEIFTLQSMPETSSAPVILKKDHIAATILERYIAYEPRVLRRWYGRLEYAKTVRWENRVCRRAAAIMACSELERSVLQGICPGVPITVGPNVVETDGYSADGCEDETAILYSGLLDWHPNQDAIFFFVDAILPELRKMQVKFKLLIAGRSSGDALRRRLAHVPEIEFFGTVPDMRPLIQRAAVCVVPLRIGSGTRFKILEAAAMGKPAVSTRIGAEGLGFVNGSEIILADEPRAFAQAVATLLANPSRRHAMGLASRRRVEADYSLPVLRRAIRDTLAFVTDGRKCCGQIQ